MSLQDEMLEQNSMYQSVMQENGELKERIQQLEQLLIEYHDFVSALLDAVAHPAKAAQLVQVAMLSDMQQRARVLLHEGQAKEDHDA